MPRIPLVRPGGTPPMVLRDRYADVGHALLDLAVAIRASAPATCDHDGATAYEHARNEHMAQIALVDKLRVHYLELLQGVQGQLDQHDTARMVKQRP